MIGAELWDANGGQRNEGVQESSAARVGNRQHREQVSTMFQKSRWSWSSAVNVQATREGSGHGG